LGELLQLCSGATFTSERRLFWVRYSTVTVTARSAISVVDRSRLTFGASLLSSRDGTILVRSGSGIDIVSSSELSAGDALLSLAGSRLEASGNGILLSGGSSMTAP